MVFGEGKKINLVLNILVGFVFRFIFESCYRDD